MQLLDLYVLVFRIVGILLAFYGVTWLSMFAGAASLEFFLGWALALWVRTIFSPFFCSPLGCT